MMGLLLDAIYAIGLVVSCPLWLYRMARHGRYREGWGEMLGAVPTRYGLQPVIWVYGVSVGEIRTAGGIVDQLHSQLPDFRVVVSAWTDTGIAEARRMFTPDYLVFRRPFDFSFAVRRALRRIRPNLVVLIEGDVWPNFLSQCNRLDIPVVVVNGRISPDKGYPRYKKLGPLAGKLFNRLAAIGVQDQTYAERFRSLGVEEGKIHVTGMIKFDTAEVADRVDGDGALAAAMGISDTDKLIVAGGTGPGEEKILLEIFTRLKQNHPEAKLALVPRKPERFDEVARLITSRGFRLARRTDRSDGTTGELPPGAVVLGDTMGELRKFYSLAYCVFIGRSLVPMGGSDMIESAALAKPTAFGPHTFNFPQADGLAANGCVRVANDSQLKEQLDAWLSDQVAAADAGRRAQQYVRSQQGAARRNVEMICRVLGRVPAVAPGAIATDKIAEPA